MLLRMLTPERVMKELKYRYDREIDKVERPALRKILEKDDVPTRRMVLCISSIEQVMQLIKLIFIITHRMIKN
jgi:hypothetical protein